MLSGPVNLSTSGSITNSGILSIGPNSVFLGTNEQLIVTNGGLHSGSTRLVVQSNAIVAPNSPDHNDHRRDFDLNAGSTLEIEIGGDGANSGTDYDQVDVGGIVTLAGELDLSLYSNISSTVNEFVIVSIAGTDTASLTGAFNLAQVNDRLWFCHLYHRLSGWRWQRCHAYRQQFLKRRLLGWWRRWSFF